MKSKILILLSIIISNLSFANCILPTFNAELINGNTKTCIGNTYEYSVDANNANSFTWNISAGATIIAGTNTNKITIKYNTVAPIILTCFANNTCGISNTLTLNIIVNKSPTVTLSTIPSDTTCQINSMQA